MKSEPVFPSRFLSFSNAAVLRSSLIAKELCLSGAVGDVICSASEVDDRSLDVFISPPPCSSTWMRKRCGGGLKKRAGGSGRKVIHGRLVIDLSILPALLMPTEGLSEAVVWGRFGGGGCFATSGEQPGPSSLERKKYTKSMILINQVLHYCTSSNFFFLSCSVKAF